MIFYRFPVLNFALWNTDNMFIYHFIPPIVNDLNAKLNSHLLSASIIQISPYSPR